MTPDIAEAIREQAEVIQGLAGEYLNCHLDPLWYTAGEGLHKPRGVTWEEFGEEQCAVLASDITVRCEQLMRLVEPGRVA